MHAETCEALTAAGAPGSEARKAAGALAQHDVRFARIETDLAVLKWMTGFTLAGVAGLMFRSPMVG